MLLCEQSIRRNAEAPPEAADEMIVLRRPLHEHDVKLIITRASYTRCCRAGIIVGSQTIPFLSHLSTDYTPTR